MVLLITAFSSSNTLEVVKRIESYTEDSSDGEGYVTNSL